MFLKKLMLQIGAVKMGMERCAEASEEHALVTKKCKLFRSLYCWTPNNYIYLMSLEQMPNTERGKALRMSRKANKIYSKVAG